VSTIRGEVQGKEFFTAMIAHFGAKVKIIEGRWSRQSGLTTNLDLFNKASAAGLAPVQAALVATKTGQWADNYGYSTVTVVDLDPAHAPGHYNRVIVQFSQ
jgi:hypothetical protein